MSFIGVRGLTAGFMFVHTDVYRFLLHTHFLWFACCSFLTCMQLGHSSLWVCHLACSSTSTLYGLLRTQSTHSQSGALALLTCCLREKCCGPLSHGQEQFEAVWLPNEDVTFYCGGLRQFLCVCLYMFKYMLVLLERRTVCVCVWKEI